MSVFIDFIWNFSNAIRVKLILSSGESIRGEGGWLLLIIIGSIEMDVSFRDKEMRYRK